MRYCVDGGGWRESGGNGVGVGEEGCGKVVEGVV